MTSRPPKVCVELLKPLSADERIRYVEHFECTGLTLFVDPVELDPAVLPAFAEVRARADRLYHEGQFGRGMGTGGRVQLWVQGELERLHGIRWRTVQQMNPGIAFD
jgi:hypothetical protein